MSSHPVSLRNIPQESLKLAHALSQHTSLSLNDVLRLALVSGLFVEATRVTPAPDGSLAGLDAAYLARALRRHLSGAIDFLIEQGQHPSLATIGSNQANRVEPAALPQQSGTFVEEESEGIALLDNALGDDLEALGLGMGLAEESLQ
jgi:hypothetical protein